ncbi:MAG: methyl-accepting chemotaxis protein, partial [Phycisphaerae bacterium]|nr:methyl-accepting chemotaxis protein [Phycisphaerae bacterium]
GAYFEYRKEQALQYTDRYGSFFSGFSPVVDAQGNVLLVVGVDLNGSVVSDASWRAVRSAAGPTAVLAILAVLAAGLLGERMVRPLHGLRAFAERVGRGDLTALADANAPGEAGEIARALNATLASLRSTVRGADETSARVREACDRLLESADSRQHAATLAAERAGDAARRALAISELATGMGTDGEAARDAAKQVAEMGAHMATDVQHIDQGVRSVIDRGQELAECLKAMRSRAATVDAAREAMVQVANRSSVLSLNAEIEANQAGSAGRGFAVVAREIRRLAEQAAANSLDIERNVAGLQDALDRGARATEGFSAAAQAAREQSARVSTSLDEAHRSLVTLAPLLTTVGERGEHVQAEGESMRRGLLEAETAARDLRSFLGSFETTLVELRDRSAEVQRLLAKLRTSA